MRIVFSTAALAACLILGAGCSKHSATTEAAPSVTLLQDVNELLRASAGGLGRPAKNVQELSRYGDTFSRGYAAVKSGEVVVVWGAKLQGEGESGKNEAVVAYEKNVPTSGGHVLLSAGTVKHMTPEEFNAAPKAGK